MRIRKKMFGAETVCGETFKTVNPKVMLRFARETQLYELLKAE
jgi:hypothetical protein